MSVNNVYSDFLTDPQIGRALQLPLSVQEALKTKLIPEELNHGKGRVLVQRCVQDLQELSQKVQQFIERINPNENKCLKIFHSSDKFRYFETLSDYKSGFKQMGEITFKDKLDTDIFDSYYLYVHGQSFPLFQFESCFISKPITCISFNITKCGKNLNVTEECLNKFVGDIKESLTKQRSNIRSLTTEADAKFVGADVNCGKCLLF